MNDLAPLAYVGIFLGSATLCLLLVPLALRVAVRRGAVDRPGGYKSQPAPVPYLGGVAMLLAFAAAVVAAALLRPPASGLNELLVIVGAAVALSLVGLVDDLRGLGVTVRLLATGAAGVALWLSGTQVVLFGVPWLDGTLTALWVVAMTNAMNLLDNMDGLSAGVATIASATLFGVAALNGQFLVAALSLALAGCAIGFLRHNRYPAKIYMGDAGSLFLGFMLATLGIRLRFEVGPPIAVFVPVVILAVPIVDTALVTITRVRAGRSPFQGGADHISHRLVRLGMSVPGAVGLVYVGAVFSGWLAVAISRQTDAFTASLLMLFWAAVLSTGGWYLVQNTEPSGAKPLSARPGRDATAESTVERL